MKLRNCRTFLSLFVTFCFVVYFSLRKYDEQKTPAYAFTVRISKVFDPNFTDEELWEYVESGNNLPIAEFKKRDLSLPNYDRFLLVSLEKDGKLKVNMQNFGNKENAAPLISMLSKTFVERKKMKVFKENSNKIVKAVIIKAPRSAKYGEVVKVIDAVKFSGAEPIVLQIENLEK